MIFSWAFAVSFREKFFPIDQLSNCQLIPSSAAFEKGVNPLISGAFFQASSILKGSSQWK